MSNKVLIQVLIAFSILYYEPLVTAVIHSAKRIYIGRTILAKYLSCVMVVDGRYSSALAKIRSVDTVR